MNSIKILITGYDILNSVRTMNIEKKNIDIDISPCIQSKMEFKWINIDDHFEMQCE